MADFVSRPAWPGAWPAVSIDGENLEYVVNRAQEAVRNMIARLLKVHGEAVTYRAGPVEISLTAARGSKLLRLGDVTLRADGDWVLDRSVLVWDGEVQTPGPGHLIEAQEDGETVTYEVQSPGAPEPCYREQLGFLRIHSTRHGILDE